MTEGVTSRLPSAAVRLRAPFGVAVTAALVCTAVWFGDPTTPGGVFPVCPFKAITGIDCPGCGTLRMLYSLLHGDVFAAVKFNALALAALAALLCGYAVWTYGRCVGRRVPHAPNYRWAIAVSVLVVAAWFVLRAIPVEPFSALHV